MRFKPGISIRAIKPELVLGLTVADSVYRTEGFDLIITEVTGGHHLTNSLHYQGLAADLRSHNIANQEQKFDLVAKLHLALGQDWDIVLEGLSTDNEHVHIEYSPKG